MLLLLLLFFLVARGNFPPGFSAEGAIDPDLYHQRFRGDILGPEPYFQWWFFWVRGSNGHHFTFTYAMSTATEPANHSGGFLGFSFVMPGGSSKGYRADRYASMNTSEAKAPLYMQVSIGEGNSLNVLSNNSWHLTGHMNATGPVFHADPTLRGVDVTWDVTLKRITGWYGEEGILDRLANTVGKGMISWSPYGHFSSAQGTITIGSETFQVSGYGNAYADSNWGDRMPTWSPGTRWPASDYGWGWYSMQSGTNTSIAIGVGLAASGFPAYTVYAGFCDLLVAGTRLTARVVTIWDDTPERTSVVRLASDGELHTLNVTRSQWVNYTDSEGTVSIPLQQDLLLETKNSVFTATCISDAAHTNRLLFPFQKQTFSDFESLGSTCSFKLVTDGKLVLEAVDKNAGVEYGRSLGK